MLAGVMGARANYVVVEDRGWWLRYSHWGAQHIDVHLAAGPEHAASMVRQQSPRDRREGWLDDRWCEGGALLDATRRHLRFFGGSEVLHALPYRRAYFALLAQTWPHWSVGWAYDGLAEFVGYVGGDRQVVRVPELLPAAGAVTAAALECAADDDLEDGFWALLSLRERRGRVLAWPVSTLRRRAHLAWVGEGLLEVLAGPDPGPAAIAGQPPRWGLHIDLAARRLGWWTAATEPGLTREAPLRWPGWDVQFWQDRYERQLAACAGAVRAPVIDLARGLDELGDRLRAHHRDPAAGAVQVVDSLRASGRTVAVTAPITEHTEVTFGARERRRIGDALSAARRQARRQASGEPPRTPE